MRPTRVPERSAPRRRPGALPVSQAGRELLLAARRRAIVSRVSRPVGADVPGRIAAFSAAEIELRIGPHFPGGAFRQGRALEM